MKKITSKDKISLRVDGHTVLEISSKGCLASDEAAAIAAARLGENVKIEAISAGEAVKSAKETLNETIKDIQSKHVKDAVVIDDSETV